MPQKRNSSKAQGADALLAQIVGLLREMETPAYLVGGAVRDTLLRARFARGERPSHLWDLDFAVPNDGMRIARRLADALGAAYYALDDERDVGRVVWAGHQGETHIVDVARFQGPDLEADLAGRDFTINAMARDATHDFHQLIDPHEGRADLEAGQLRAVSDQSLRDDPVRGLRAVRLAAELGFEIEPRTQTLIQEAAPGLAEVSAERMRDELVKILSLPATADSLRRLDTLNLLAEILPEVTVLKGVAQTMPHRWNAYEHTLHTVAACEALLPLVGSPVHPDVPFPDQVANHLGIAVTGGHSRRLLLTLAALLHDVGKADTASVAPDGRARFIKHERVGAKMAAKALRRLRFAGAAVRLVETVVRHHLRPLQLAWQGVVSKRAIHRFFRDTGDSGVEIALLALADRRATLSSQVIDDHFATLQEAVRMLLDAYFNRQQTVVGQNPLLTGHDLIQRFGLREGPEVGRVLTALVEAQAVGQVTSRQQAEAWIRRTLSELGLVDE